tara:strand:+ start:527 stop:1411 length:885 start_codon:yes stop_codon:yes gene_type:complete
MSLVYLTEDTLGVLELGPISLGGGLRECNAAGYIVTGWEIGFPGARPVVRNRALSDGTIDSTRFIGSRAVSMAITLDVTKQDPQISIDNLTAYMSPRLRPRLNWTIPGSTQERSLLVRGESAPVSIQRPQANTITASFIGVRGVLESPDESTLLITPGSDVEAGRTYDLTFDRVYPAGAPIGSRIAVNYGNEATDWSATIFGPAVNPTLTINGVDMSFDRDGGQSLSAGETLTINTRTKTIYLNNDPTASRYDKINFTDWSWEQVRFVPGQNIVQYEEPTLQGSCQFTWRSAWL